MLNYLVQFAQKDVQDVAGLTGAPFYDLDVRVRCPEDRRPKIGTTSKRRDGCLSMSKTRSRPRALVMYAQLVDMYIEAHITQNYTAEQIKYI